MEKSEFGVLIKHYFLHGKILSETKAKLDEYYSDSAPSRRMEWFRSGLPNFVVVVQAQKPYQVQVVQMRI